MSRRDIGLNPTYIIVGRDWDGVEHFIGSSGGCGWLTTFLRTVRYRFNYRYRDRYSEIYMKKLYV